MLAFHTGICRVLGVFQHHLLLAIPHLKEGEDNIHRKGGNNGESDLS